MGGLALACKDSQLLERCLTQSTIDAYNAWKLQMRQERDEYSLEAMSLMYRISKIGLATMEAALEQGLRFSRSDTLKCHDGIPTILGPVGSLALAASESADQDEQASFGRLAVLCLESEMDDPQALVYQNGVPGGMEALAALS